MNKLNNQDVLKLLTGLKNVENTYPTELQQSRRDSYIKQTAAMAVLMKAGQRGNETNSVGGGSSLPFPPGKILEIVILSAIILEGVVVVYAYRDRIRDFFNDTRTGDFVIPTDNDFLIPSFEAPSAGDEAVTDTPVPTVTVTAMEEPTFTPIIPTDSNSDGVVESEQIIATPAPKENPGNHYGNTPKPDRDKDTKDEKDKENKK